MVLEEVESDEARCVTISVDAAPFNNLSWTANREALDRAL